jgi:hypothetical protein
VKETAIYNTRLGASGDLKAEGSCNGAFVTDFIDITNINKLKIEGTFVLSTSYSSLKYGKLSVYDANGNYLNSGINFDWSPSDPTYDWTFDVIACRNNLPTATKIRICLTIAENTAITSADVTDVKIIAVDGITNQIPISTDANGNLFVGTNGEKGYKTNTRISGSSGGESAATGVEATGFIPIKHGDTMYLKGIVDDGTHVVCFYNSARAKIVSWGWSTEFPNGLDGSIASFTLGFGNFAGSGVENTAFVRLSANEITDSSIITVNQPIE